MATRFSFRLLVRLARIILPVPPVGRLGIGPRLYEWGYRLCRRRGCDLEVVWHGLRLTGPAEDRFMMARLFGGYYEEQELAAFTALAGGCRRIVDIGANIGLYACAGAAAMPPDGQLLAFEPVPAKVAYLRHNIE